jgi:DNA-binding transcriptional regulator GbsR (MarR family)
MVKTDKISKYLNIPVDKKVPRKLLIRAIRQKYDTLDELGEALGISKQSVSDAINRQTDKFMQRLADKAGIDLSTINSQIISDNKFGNIKGDIEFNSHSSNNAQEEIKELKRDLKQKRNYIDRLEKENKELRKRLSKYKGFK